MEREKDLKLKKYCKNLRESATLMTIRYYFTF